MLGLAVLLPLTPDTFQNAWALSRDGEAFATLLPVGPTDTGIALDLYLRLMRACLATAWVAWMVLVALAQPDAAPRARTMWALAGLGVALTVAAVPPMLSGDALAYVAYGRIPGLHGLNPYLEGGQALAARVDPSARFLVWDTPLPYGPLWALVAAAVAKLGLGLHAELLVHKAWAGLSLLGAAAAAGRLAAFRGAPLGSWAPLVIAFNPLLLVEGPGSGHNDIVMVALLLWAAVKSARHHAVGAAVVVGLAVAIKPVALLAVPLVIAAHARPSAGMSTALRVITLLALTLMPTLVLSLPFGGPGVLARAIVSRAAVVHTQTPLMIAGALTGACAYAVWRMRQAVLTTPAGWLDAWVPVALAVGVVAMPLNFPWYLTWAAAPALTLPGRHGLGAVVVTTVVGVMLMWRYTIPI
jgi:hypothetical protein